MPHGWHVRTKVENGHEVRLAFPPGKRKKGSGKLISILHPKSERNPELSCFDVLEAAVVEAGAPEPGTPEFNQLSQSTIELLQEVPVATNPDLFERAQKKLSALFSSKLGSKEKAKEVEAIEPGKNPCGKKNRARKKNLDEVQAAQKLYETFQGKPAVKVSEIDEPDDRRDDFAQLGWLVELVIQPRRVNGELIDEPVDAEKLGKLYGGLIEKASSSQEAWTKTANELGVSLVVLNFKQDQVRLCSNAEGAQLYLVGGKQDLDPVLSKFDTDEKKDFVELGWLVALTYFTRKAQTNFEPTDFYHILGEEDGLQPFAYYNRLQKRTFIVGGDYTVEQPGIIN